MLALTNLEGLLFWPRGRVAMIREEWEGRLEVLSADGELAHRPGPLPDGPPFVRLDDTTLVNPAHAVQAGDRVELPGGWSLQGRLPPAPPAPPAPEDPWIEDAGAHASEVLYLDAGGRGKSWWVTDRGRQRGLLSLSGKQKAALHPDLRAAGQSFHVNPRRLRFLRRDAERRDLWRLGFDEGTVLTLSKVAAPLLTRHLGLAALDEVGGETDGQRHLRRLGLRRWPKRLATAPTEYLQREFAGHPALLIANVAMQTVEARQRGETLLEGDAHRAWFYRPGRQVLRRAGHLRAGSETLRALSWWSLLAPRRYRRISYPTFGAEPPLDPQEAWTLVCRVLTHLVLEVRRFTYRDMGFRDQKPHHRLLGDRHPDLVVLVEKESLLETARLLHEAFGVTVFVTGGLPPAIGAEFLVEDLRARGVRAARLLSFCDYDVEGWDMPTMLQPQLERYGMPVEGIRRLVTPECFTDEELDRLSVPIGPGRTPVHRSRVARWMRETGGIRGRRRGVHANALPADRVVAAFPFVAGGWL